MNRRPLNPLPSAGEGGPRSGSGEGSDLFGEGAPLSGPSLTRGPPSPADLGPARLRAGGGGPRTGDNAKPPDDEPHYHGHRDRLRARFLQAGAEALADYELLELVLFRAIPRRDVKPLAKALITRFGSLAEVLTAEPEQLAKIDGISAGIVADLKLVAVAGQRIARGSLKNRPLLSSWGAVYEYLRATMALAAREEFRILFLNKRNHLIRDEVQGRGTVDHTPVYIREIARRALELSATAVILAHNHPSGDPTPSGADIRMTREVVSVLDPLGIVVHDHVILGREGHASFKGLKLL